MKTTLLWALWLSSGGYSYSGHLYIAAYFEDAAECQRVANIVAPKARHAQCIQARYSK